MRFRFQLTHSIEGSLEITEPGAWQESILRLDRDENFHSLIEYFDGSFIFYGTNGIVNGGIDFIKNIEQTYGIDETIVIQIDITFDEIVFDNVFTGQFKFSDLEELMDNKMRLPIFRDDFWSKFISRLDIPVNIQSTTNQDGGAIDPLENIIAKLTSQMVRATYRGENKDVDLAFNVAERWDIAGNEFGIIDFPITILDEIEEKFSLPITDSPTRPVNLFEVTYGGVYDIDFSMSVWSIIEHSAAQAATQFEFSINNSTPIVMTRTDIGTPGIDQRTEFTYADTLNLLAGDQLRFYIRNTSGSLITVIQPKKSLYLSYLNIIADTIYPETNNEGFLIHDVAAAITDRIIGQDDTFYSELLGSSLTRARQYETDGCAWTYLNIKGLQLRLYTLEEKPFFISFNQWWKGANPILNLGLGYDEIETPIGPGWEPFTLPALNFWGIANTSAQAWFWTGGIANPFLTVPSGITPGTDSDWFGPIVSFESGHTYKYELQFTAFSDVADQVYVSIVIGDTFFVILEQLGQTVIASPSGVSGTVTLEFIAGATANRMAVIANYPSGSGNDGSIVIDSFTDLTESVPASDGTATVIRVEEKEYFYLNEISVYFSNVRATRKYDNDRLFNKIEIGYTQWQSENSSGIDDPQTKKNYSTRFQKVGKTINLYSDWIAASLAIETTRRTTREKSADYKFDNETFIISLNPTEIDESPDESPDLIHLTPELDENFTSITNLLNSHTRYNIKLTPARNLLRWQNFLQGALQSYLGSDIKFNGGEGNYDMTSQMVDASPDCLNEDYDGQVLSEKAPIPVTNNFLHTAHLYEITIPMEWTEYQTIRANRRKAIGISLGDSGHKPMFIKTLSYKPVKGTCDLLVWAKEYLELSVTPDTTPMQECMPLGSECEDALTDIDGNILTNELGICITA